MLFVRAFQQVVIFFFLLITLAAFLLTVFRIDPPAFVRPVVRFSYAMMAPYQDYERLNAGLVARGQDRAGEWHPIALDPYLPVIRGESHMRQFFLIYAQSGSTLAHATRTAQTLLRLEQQKGHAYAAVRLSWNQWHPSPAGYDALATTDYYSRPLVTVHE